ncbi:MAG: cell division protein FtsA [Eubacteriales bacterium]|nr:cell division protein FtsA [Eubacteriales bacterium]
MSGILVGVDIGTTKVCTVICRLTGDQDVEFLGKGLSRYPGVKKGIITDIEKTADCIMESVREAENAAGMEVYSAYVNIIGAHVSIIRNHTSALISNERGEITQEDIHKVMYDFSGIEVPDDQQVIDIIPEQFIVDGYDGISDPTGMVGTRLEVEEEVITGKVTSVQNIIKSMERAGLKVDGMIIEGLSTGNLALTPQERETGAMLIDVGGGITDVTVFRNNRIEYYGTVPAGGEHITGDIAIGLRITPLDAEKIKKDYELASLALIKNNHEIKVTEAFTGRKKAVHISEIVDIIEARVNELFQLSLDAAGENGADSSSYSSVVITGSGISYLDGAVQLAGNVFNKPARTASYKLHETLDLSYAPVFGIIKYVAGRSRVRKSGCEVRAKKHQAKSKGKKDFGERIAELLKNFF